MTLSRPERLRWIVLVSGVLVIVAPIAIQLLLFREGDDPMDSSPPLFSGDKDIPVPGGWTNEPTIYWEQLEPLPMTVLSIMPRIESGER